MTVLTESQPTGAHHFGESVLLFSGKLLDVYRTPSMCTGVPYLYENNPP